MDLLDKLSAVEISNDNHITEEDRQICEAYQMAYYEAKSDLEKLFAMWSEMYEKQRELLYNVSEDSYVLEKFVRMDRLADYDFTEKLEELPSLFINSIYRYFARTYNVTINEDRLLEILLPKKATRRDNNGYSGDEYKRKLRELKLTYKEVLEQIRAQFDGKDFTEIAIEQIRKKVNESAWDTYHGKPNYEVKKDTIKFSGFFCTVNEWSRYCDYSLTENMKRILRGMALFETGVVGKYPHYMEMLLNSSGHRFSSVSFYGCDKFVSLRMYKNRRVDVKFKSKEFAKQFADDYLGRVCLGG